MKVDFLIIGAARSGTTSLSAILASHPEIGFCSVKEPQFFCKENWRDNLQEYHSLFTKEAKIYGEGSTNYSKYPSFNPSIHEAIFEYNPRMKLIYIMRHPIERIISHYKFSVERGNTTNEIDHEILSNPIYLDTSRYYFQIKPYLDLFGKENVKLILLDNLKSSPEKVLKDIFYFLGVSNFNFSKKFIHSNRSQSGIIGHKKYDNPKSISDKIKKGLHFLSRKLNLQRKHQNYYPSEATIDRLKLELNQDVKQIEKLMGKDLSHWLN